MENKKEIIKLSELKILVSEKLKKLFDKHKFNFNKSGFEFMNETSTSKINCYFRFISCYPSHNEYNFFCYIKLKELDFITKAFKKFTNDKSEILWNVIIAEGEFINDLRGIERKFQKAYSNEVDTVENSKKALDQTYKIIELEVLPLISLIDNLKGFQNYFLTPVKIIQRVTDYNFVLSCLLAAYLINEQFCFEIIDFLEKEIEGRNFAEISNLIKKIKEFILVGPPLLAQE